MCSSDLGKTFVVFLGGDALLHSNLVNIVHDLALLNVLGVRLVIVHGARPQLNEAFAAQVLAVMRKLQLKDDAERVNPNGGAIAVGHPLGASGARIAITATRQLERMQGRYAAISLCIGIGQGVAAIIERM